MPQKITLSASDIANYFLLKAKGESRKVTNKKLQKLLYYAQAWSLVVRKEGLFEEKIEAWVHGPAIRSIYLQNKKFGFGFIETDVTSKDLPEIPTDVKDLLDEIWSVYGKFDAAYLEKLTHSEAPWLKAREGLDANENSENEITLDSMKEFYSSVLERALADEASVDKE